MPWPFACFEYPYCKHCTCPIYGAIPYDSKEEGESMRMVTDGLQLLAFLLLSLGVVLALITIAVGIASLLYASKRKTVLKGYQTHAMQHVASTEAQS